MLLSVATGVICCRTQKSPGWEFVTPSPSEGLNVEIPGCSRLSSSDWTRFTSLGLEGRLLSGWPPSSINRGSAKQGVKSALRAALAAGVRIRHRRLVDWCPAPEDFSHKRRTPSPPFKTYFSGLRIAGPRTHRFFPTFNFV
jgi:hypothetical protein